MTSTIGPNSAMVSRRLYRSMVNAGGIGGAKPGWLVAGTRTNARLHDIWGHAAVDSGCPPESGRAVDNPLMSRNLKPISLGERPGSEPYNTSEVLALSDSTFLFCDNNVSDALFEFRLKQNRDTFRGIARRRIEGLTPGGDRRHRGHRDRRRRWSHLHLRHVVTVPENTKGQHPKKKRGKVVASRKSIIRIAVGPNHRLRAEVIPGFGPWLIEHVPWLQRAARLIPDDGGLNVEAISWDPRQKALLFGLRTPSMDGKPVVLRVKPRRIDGPWIFDDLEVLPPLTLALPNGDGEAGIRAMSLEQSTGTSLIILGNATSQSKASFKLYSWDGNPRGIVRHYKSVKFHRRMKVEGVTRGTVRGRPAVIFVDDGGGFQMLWGNDERLASPVRVSGTFLRSAAFWLRMHRR